MIIDGGRFHGGDSSFVYRGKLRPDDQNRVIANVEVEKHSKALVSVFQDAVPTPFRLNLKGLVALAGDGIALSGEVEGSPQFTITMQLNKLGELIDEER